MYKDMKWGRITVSENQQGAQELLGKEQFPLSNIFPDFPHFHGPFQPLLKGDRECFSTFSKVRKSEFIWKFEGKWKMSCVWRLVASDSLHSLWNWMFIICELHYMQIIMELTVHWLEDNGSMLSPIICQRMFRGDNFTVWSNWLRGFWWSSWYSQIERRILIIIQTSVSLALAKWNSQACIKQGPDQHKDHLWSFIWKIRITMRRRRCDWVQINKSSLLTMWFIIDPDNERDWSLKGVRTGI